MKNLDLKMVIHHGEYVIQKLGDHEELMGADVIVPHRMLKTMLSRKPVSLVTPYSAKLPQKRSISLNLPNPSFHILRHTNTLVK